jgi:hypothetical protein
MWKFIYRVNFLNIWEQYAFLYESANLPHGSFSLDSACALLIKLRNVSAGRILHLSLNFMLNRQEVIAQLKRIGVRDSSFRKMHLQDFEK